MVGPQPLEENKIDSTPAISRRGITFEQFDLEEIIDENLEKVKFDERERVNSRDYYGDFFF